MKFLAKQIHALACLVTSCFMLFKLSIEESAKKR